MRKQNGMLTRATGQKKQIFKIQDGGRPPFWKSLNCLISVKHCPISMKFGTLQQMLNPIMQSRDQVLKFKTAATTILKIAFLAITHRPIVQFWAKFCVRKQNGMRTKATWEKLQIFKIQDGGQPPFWKSLYRHIVKNLPILMKFGTLHQILNPITVTWQKIEIFKIRDGDGGHLENRFFGHNSLTDCQISAKFCTRKQNGMPTKVTWQKLQIRKIEEG